MIIFSDYLREKKRLHRRALAGYAFMVAGFIIVGAYFVYQTRDWILLPDLLVTAPTDGMSLRGPAVVIEGVATPGIRLTVNGVDAYNDRGGFFRVELLLPAGLHDVDVVAKNRFGRTRSVKRQIVVENQ